MDLVTIARLNRARGIKGELIGQSDTSHPGRFQNLDRVWLRHRNGVTEEAHVEQVWDFRGRPVFKFAGIDSMTAAGRLAGCEVCLPVEERAPLEEGEYYFSDLLDCEAVDRAGAPLGRLVHWQELPGSVMFEVDDGRGAPYLVPFHRDIFREIDLPARRVVLDLPAGLRELNR
jgi:16S rRNA processing protein RimM